MSRRRFGLEAELYEAGFSSRTINAIIYGLGIQSLDELRSAPWGSIKEPDSFAWRLSVTPNLGKKGVAEIEAFRAGRDPREARPAGPTYLSVPFDNQQLALLDAWIERQGDKASRPEAIRKLVAQGSLPLGEATRERGAALSARIKALTEVAQLASRFGEPTPAWKAFMDALGTLVAEVQTEGQMMEKELDPENTQGLRKL